MVSFKGLAQSLLVVTVVTAGSFVFFGMVQKKVYIEPVSESAAVPLGLNGVLIVVLLLVALIGTRFVLKRGVEGQ